MEGGPASSHSKALECHTFLNFALKIVQRYKPLNHSKTVEGMGLPKVK
jgi:hypothetical protein